MEDARVVVARKHIGDRALNVAGRTLHVLLLEHHQRQFVQGEILPDGGSQVVYRGAGEPVFALLAVAEGFVYVGYVVRHAGQCPRTLPGVVKRQQHIERLVATLLRQQVDGPQPLACDIRVSVEADAHAPYPGERVGIGPAAGFGGVLRGETPVDDHLLSVVARTHPLSDACGVERPNPVVGVFDVVAADQDGYVAGGGQKLHVPAARVLGKVVHQGDVTGGRVDIVGDVGVEKPVRGLPAPRVVAGVPQRPAQRIGAEVETLGVNGLVFDGTVQFGQQQFRFALAAGDESGKAESAGDIWRKSLHRFGFIDKFIKKDESRTVSRRRFVARFALRGRIKR